MPQKNIPSVKDRQKREAAALRTNLLKRKDQQRSRLINTLPSSNPSK